MAPSFSFARTSAEVRAAGEAALKRLAALGAELVEVELAHQDLAIPALWTLLAIEFAAAYAEPWARLGPKAFGPLLRTEIEFAQTVNGPRLIAAQQARRLVQEAYAKVLSKVDVFVSATALAAADLLDGPFYEVPGHPNWLENALWCTGPANLTGLPALSLPVGFNGLGLPLAVQFTAGAFEERTLLRVAATLEADLALTDRHPKL